MPRPGPPRSRATHRLPCSTRSECSTTTAPTRTSGRSTRRCSTGHGPVRTSSRPRSRASRSVRRTSRAPDAVWAQPCASGSAQRRRWPAAGLRAFTAPPPRVGRLRPPRSPPWRAGRRIFRTACSSMSTPHRGSTSIGNNNGFWCASLSAGREAAQTGWTRYRSRFRDPQIRGAGRSRSAGSGTPRALIEIDGTGCSPTRCGAAAARRRRRRAATPAPDAGGPGRAARRGRGGDLPRPLRPPRHGHDVGLARTPARPVLWCRSASARTCAGGASPRRIIELDWNESRRIGGLRWCAPRRGTSPAGSRPQHHAVGVMGDRRPAAPGVLRRRHRLHPELRRHRRRPRAFRPDTDADRGLRPGMAGHPHEPRGSRARPPRRRRAGSDCWCRSTGRRSGSRRTRGRSRSSACSRPPNRRACSHRAKPGNVSTATHRDVRPWWQL